MKVKFFATFREFTRCKEEDIPAPPDIWTLLSDLSERYGAAFRAKLLTPDGNGIGEETIILLNGRNIIYIDGKNTSIADSDVVSIFPVVAGG